MNTTKKELINKIAEVCEEHGFNKASETARTFPRSNSFIDTLKWLPVENLQKMLDCDISKCKDFQEAYQKWGRYGALRFAPYVVQNEDNPSICIRRDRFLHMFRGYYFQVSSTESGICSNGSNFYRTQFMTTNVEDNKILKKGLLSYMLWFMSLIYMGFQYDNFREQWNEDKTVVNDFLRRSMNYWYVGRDQDWEDISGYFDWTDGNIDKSRTRWQLLNNNGVPYAYAAVGSKTIQVETANNVLLTVAIPSMTEKSGYDMDDEDDRDDFEYHVEDLKRNDYLSIILLGALSMCGVNLNTYGWHFFTGCYESMDKLSGENVHDLYSINSLDSKYYDEF